MDNEEAIERRWKQAISAMECDNAEGALYLLKSLAAEGDSAAMAEIGVIYETGPGSIPVDISKTVTWYTRAADKGNLEGLLALARLSLIGEGLSRDYIRARNLYESILDRTEDPRALFGLGWIYHQGFGVKVDLNRASEFYVRAARAGHLLAPKWLAAILWFHGKYASAVRCWIKAVLRIWKTALFDKKNMRLYRQL
ncbi:MAG: tetratricopeptide repeat protein [Hydrogenophaga sp.]|uniref:tetratricopeptide repeat protein n=1 Tax=Hydrogenophaga sp. TaxID=1904254 RepID=UPI002AB8065E|nr:tetratricopeptide repeat protein [Hydrogenophaga sp.]MDZ4283393.1 tetratricopeptide repeat protein [Hydrogenophaga sp.]